MVTTSGMGDAILAAWCFLFFVISVLSCLIFYFLFRMPRMAKYIAMMSAFFMLLFIACVGLAWLGL